MWDAKDLEEVEFVPFEYLDKAKKILSSSHKKKSNICSKSLLYLQQQQQGVGLNVNTYRHHWFRSISEAIYSHDWDKLATYLKKVNNISLNSREAPILMHAFVILLMFHPESKSHEYLMEYIELGLGCKTDLHKRAMMKMLLTLSPDIQCNERALNYRCRRNNLKLISKHSKK